MEKAKSKQIKYKGGNIYREDKGYCWQKYLGKEDNSTLLLSPHFEKFLYI